MKRELPLTGARIADFGIGGVGPWAGSLLAQLGATVVKIEAPNEFILEVLPSWRTATTTYRALNLGKRSVSLNLKDERDLLTAWKLIEGADVMLENFRSGAMERLGFGFEAVSARNPAIVYCSASGFGSRGDMAGLPCTDPHMQAFSGFAAINGHLAEGERLRFYGAVDLFTSNLIVESILAGLLRRHRTGQPQRVEVAMLGGATTALLSQLAAPAMGREQAQPRGRHGGHVHPDAVYRAKDRSLAVSVESDEEFGRFCAAIGRPDLRERREFETTEARLEHRDALDKEIEDTLASAPAEWWLIALRRARIPSAPVHSDYELMAHRDAWAHGHLREMEDRDPSTGDTSVVAGPPWDFVGVEASRARAPSPGKHTDLIGDEAIDDLWVQLEETLP